MKLTNLQWAEVVAAAHNMGLVAKIFRAPEYWRLRSLTSSITPTVNDDAALVYEIATFSGDYGIGVQTSISTPIYIKRRTLPWRTMSHNPNSRTGRIIERIIKANIQHVAAMERGEEVPDLKIMFVISTIRAEELSAADAQRELHT